VSWLSSAVLGFLDAAYVPFAVAALVAAASGRSGRAGMLVALAALIKPQGILVAPAVVLALRKHGASIWRGAVFGLAVVGVALLPFAIEGTLEEAVTHVFRILFQQRLSAGYANIWWIAGHVANGAGLTEPVSFARIDTVPLPAALIALAMFALAVYRFCSSARSSLLAGAAVVFSFGMLALGVHENHPHAMFLAFTATGLVCLELRIVTGVLSLTYVLNMLALSGLGRFYGLRYMALEPTTAWISRLRIGLGLDLTLFLAAVNIAIFAWLALSLLPCTARSRTPSR
jgi:hypothetical protein